MRSMGYFKLVLNLDLFVKYNPGCFNPQFDADKVWDHLLHTLDVNVFMAVPTIYVKLIASHATSLSDEIRPLVKTKLMEKMRLMVSGSAALPTPVLNQWLDISGHTLLERYTR